MKKKLLILSALVGFLSISAGFTLATNQERISSNQLMTEQERVEWRAQLLNKKTPEGEMQIQMKERSREHGFSPSRELPAKGDAVVPGVEMRPGVSIESGGSRNY